MQQDVTKYNAVKKAPNDWEEQARKKKKPDALSDSQKDETLVLQTVKISRQLAIARAIVIQTWMVQVGWDIMKAHIAAGQDYAFSASQISDPATREQELGPQHVRIWMSVIKYLTEQAQEGVKISDKTSDWRAKLEQLTEYNAHVAYYKY